MLFLYRPHETWMPFSLPRNQTQQAAYNRQLQQQFDATRRVAPAVPAPTVPVLAPRDPIADLKELAALHASGALSDAEFTAAKANLVGP